MTFRETLRTRAEKLKTDIPALFLALREKKTPWYAKTLAGLTVAYALSPIDLIPDFIPVLGYADDFLILPALVALTVRCIPADIWENARRNATGLWADGKPKRWYYALPIVAVWLLVAVWVLRLIF